MFALRAELQRLDTRPPTERYPNPTHTVTVVEEDGRAHELRVSEEEAARTLARLPRGTAVELALVAVKGRDGAYWLRVASVSAHSGAK